MDLQTSSRRSIIGRVIPAIGLVVLWFHLIAGGSQAAQDAQQQASQQDVVDQARQFVRQLASHSFPEREQATRKLAGLGVLAESALREGLESKDAEVRDRCQLILRDVLTTDFQARIKRFKNDLEGTQSYGLPGFEEFVARFDNTPEAREFFVRMMELSPRVMRSVTGEAEQLAAAIDEQADFESYNARVFDTPEVTAALLHTSAQDDVQIQQTTVTLISFFAISGGYAKIARQGPQAEISRALLNRWLNKHIDHVAPEDCIEMTAQFDLSAGLPLVRKYAVDSRVAPADRMSAILAVAKLGDKSDIPLLKELFEAREVARSYTLPNGHWETQLRDIALACVLHLSGEDPKDFGFVNRERNDRSVFRPDTLSFSGERERQMAFAKYYARFGQSGGGD